MDNLRVSRERNSFVLGEEIGEFGYIKGVRGVYDEMLQDRVWINHRRVE
jgi:hypothetical protein